MSRKKTSPEPAFNPKEKTWGSWVRQNIQCLECHSFIRDEESQGERCMCGLLKNEHSRRLQSPTSEFDSTADVNRYGAKTSKTITNAYGEIHIAANSKCRLNKFIRLSDDTDMTLLDELLLEQWKLKVPNFVFSLVGETGKGLLQQTRYQEKLYQDFIKAFNLTQDRLWLITDGLYRNFSKFISTTVQEYAQMYLQNRITMIGIAHWGSVKSRNQLENENGMGHWTGEYDPNVVNTDQSGFGLDPNDAHLLLVDDGTVNKQHSIRQFQCKLEESIASWTENDKMENENEERGFNVVVVKFLMEDTERCFEEAALATKKGLPVVVIKGCGRGCDILANFCSTDNASDREMEQQIQEQFPDLSPEGIQNATSNLRICVEKLNLVTVYAIEDDSMTLNKVISEALYKANADNPWQILQLAITWNQLEVARFEEWREFIQENINTNAMREIFYKAVLYSHTGVASMLLHNGFNLQEFLTMEMLQRLYSHLSPSMVFYRKLRPEQIKILNQDKAANRKYCPWCSHSKCQCVRQNALALSKIGEVLNSITMGPYFKAYIKMGKKRIKKTKKHSENPDTREDGLEAYRDIFIFCVLSERREFATFLLEHSPNPILSATLGAIVVYHLAKISRSSNKREVLQMFGRELETIGCGILTLCYENHEFACEMLLKLPVQNYGNGLLLDASVECHLKHMGSHYAVKQCVNNLWWGRLQREAVSPLHVIVLCLIPFIVPCVVKCIPNTRSPCIRQDSSIEATIKEEEDTTCFDKCIAFFDAPITKFCYFFASFLVFLGVFSYWLVSAFKTSFNTGTEIYLLLWVISFAVQEIYEIARSRSPKILMYLHDPWNILDAICLILFFVGMILRYIPTYWAFEAARAVLAIDLMFFWFRILQAIILTKKMGPKLIMIQHMIKDLVFVAIIWGVAVIGYGTAAFAILYPDETNVEYIATNLIKNPFWQTVGEFNLDQMMDQGEQQCSTDHYNLTVPRCTSLIGKYVVPNLLVFYVLFANVLLLNLLIAMFSFTYNKVEEESRLYSNIQWYHLVIQYKDIHTLNFIVWVIKQFSKCATCCRDCCRPNCDNLDKCSKKDIDQHLIDFETSIARHYLATERLSKQSKIENT